MGDRKPKRISRLLGRKLHIGDKVWTYQLGRTGATIRDPNGKKRRASIRSLTGYSQDEWDRAIRKGSPYQIKPSMVRQHIEQNLV